MSVEEFEKFEISQKVNFNWKPGLVLKYFKNELNFCKEFGSEDKLYCGTYCCNTFSRSESVLQWKGTSVACCLWEI
jgi:hypothetical protein